MIAHLSVASVTLRKDRGGGGTARKVGSATQNNNVDAETSTSKQVVAGILKQILIEMVVAVLGQYNGK